MGFLKSFFRGDSSSPDIVRKIDLGKYFYLMDYPQHYAEFLSDAPDQKLAISELYMFRAWTTHFGFEIFSSNKNISERITYELWNLADTLGRVVLKGKYTAVLSPTEALSLIESQLDGNGSQQPKLAD